jgi:hypothetical protein
MYLTISSISYVLMTDILGSILLTAGDDQLTANNYGRGGKEFVSNSHV